MQTATVQLTLIDELTPFIAGLVTQILGSCLQYFFLSKLRAKHSPDYDETLRDGDLVQLVCTATAIVPSAVIALKDRETLMILTIFGSILIVGLSILLYKVWDADEYLRYSRAFFTPAFNTSVLCCVAGGLVAYFGHG